jgi:hypothetical protein
MKTKFSALPVREVTLQHGEQVVVVTLHPLPIGYAETAGALLGRPVTYVNGQPKDDPKRMPEYDRRLSFLVLAKALGDEIDTPRPRADADGAVWAKYADDVRDEMAAACFVEGDLLLLMQEMQNLNRGHGTLGKA